MFALQYLVFECVVALLILVILSEILFEVFEEEVVGYWPRVVPLYFVLNVLEALALLDQLDVDPFLPLLVPLNVHDVYLKST